MRIFISWSGELSRAVACALRDWLPSVIQSIKPYVSSEDIDKGLRWSNNLALELQDSKFGIICVTRDNIAAPWINFEAGALSKTIDEAKVVPFLFDIKPSDLRNSPLVQFQAASYDKNEIRKLVSSINDALDPAQKLDSTLREKGYEKWWPDLDEHLMKLANHHASSPELPNSGPPNDMDSKQIQILEELLDLTRNQHKIMMSLETTLRQQDLGRYIHFAGHNPQIPESQSPSSPVPAGEWRPPSGLGFNRYLADTSAPMRTHEPSTLMPGASPSPSPSPVEEESLP